MSPLSVAEGDPSVHTGWRCDRIETRGCGNGRLFRPRLLWASAVLAEEEAMMQLHVDQRVQVMQDIPELELHRGDTGVVCSIWFAPASAYEVEFQQRPPSSRVRALLMPNQITPDTQLKE